MTKALIKLETVSSSLNKEVIDFVKKKLSDKIIEIEDRVILLKTFDTIEGLDGSVTMVKALFKLDIRDNR